MYNTYTEFNSISYTVNAEKLKKKVKDGYIKGTILYVFAFKVRKKSDFLLLAIHSCFLIRRKEEFFF